MAVADRPLVDRLVAEAESVLRDLSPELRRKPGQLRSVNIELELRTDGQLGASTAYVERRVRTGIVRPERPR